MPKYRMTASTTTSASSRSSDEPAEVRGWSAATAGCWGAAMKFLGDELSADPFQLLLTRVTQLDLSPLETAADLHRHAEPGFGLGGTGAGAWGFGEDPGTERRIVAAAGRDARRHRAEAGEPRRAPPSLAGDQLITVCTATHEQWLQDPVLSYRLRELAQRLGIESRANLLVRGPYLIDGDHLRHHRFSVARHGDECIESAAEATRAWLRHRSNSSFARARYAAAPRDVGSYWITDLPWLGASLIRTLRGMKVFKTCAGCILRTSWSTSHESVVRASNCVINMPATSSLGLSRERTSW